MIVDIVFCCVVGWIIYDWLFSPTAIWRSKQDVVAWQRRQNAKRGITMRPGWVYRLPGGVCRMSRTGRPEDAVEWGTTSGTSVIVQAYSAS